VQHAVDVYKRGLASRLVLSSGYVYSFPEAQVMRSLAVQQGVPDEAIVLEEQSTDTHQNVEYVNDIMRRNGWHSALLVSSPYHMRRALLTWHKAAPDVRVVPAAPPRSQFYDHARGATFEQLRAILYEYLAILGYWQRGWV